MDLRGELVSAKERLEAALDEAEPSEVAGLVREFRAVVTQLAGLPVEESNPVDDLTARRQVRRAAAAGS